MASKTLFTNGLFFQGDQSEIVHQTNLLVDENGKIEGFVKDDEIKKSKFENDLKIINLNKKFILPSFIDAHCHLMMLGQSLTKIDLFQCKSIEEVIETLYDYDQKNPNLDRILARNWLQDMKNLNKIDKKLIDKKIKKPVYIMSFDLHSCLCNSAALKEMGIDENTQEPFGGKLIRIYDEEEKCERLTGWLKEMACINFVAPTLRRFTSEKEKQDSLLKSFDALLIAGYTGVGDLLMEEDVFAMLEEMVKRDGKLPLRVSCYWHCSPEKEDKDFINHIKRAKELQQRWKDNEWLQVKGIKLVVDGVIDSCTASLSLPYQDGTNSEPLWPFEKLQIAIQEADKMDLQCAIHAIGDNAVHITTEALSTLNRERILKNRHRIEHLELTHEKDVEKLGLLGITTSIQPVHSDPEILPNWYNQLGGDLLESSSFNGNTDKSPDHRCCRAFAYNDFLQKGCPIAIGTDSPTAPFQPIPNIFIAISRKSVLNQTLKIQTNSKFALPLFDTILASTKGSSIACHLDHLQGDFEIGKYADFNILDLNLLENENDHQAILQAKVIETFRSGVLVAKDGKLV